MWQAAPPKKDKPRRRFPLLLVVTVVVIGLIGLYAGDNTTKAHPERMAYLPQVQEWSVEKLGVEIAGISPKAAVLVFYTTWCPHCKAMFPGLLELYRESDPAKVAFYFVAFDREPEIIANFLAHHDAPKEVTFWRIPAAESETLTRWAEGQKLTFQGGVPYVAIYGRDGKAFRDFYGRVGQEKIEEALKLAQARDIVN